VARVLVPVLHSVLLSLSHHDVTSSLPCCIVCGYHGGTVPSFCMAAPNPTHQHIPPWSSCLSSSIGRSMGVSTSLNHRGSYKKTLSHSRSLVVTTLVCPTCTQGSLKTAVTRLPLPFEYRDFVGTIGHFFLLQGERMIQIIGPPPHFLPPAPRPLKPYSQP
jgi:hypothetical protein